MLTLFRLFIGIICLFSIEAAGQEQLKTGEKKLLNNEIAEAKKVFLGLREMPEAQEYLGDIASFEKNWDEAIKYYQGLVDMDPENAMYNFKLGGALGMKAYYGSKIQAALLLGDIKKYLRKAADLDPSHKETRRALVEFYMQIPEFLGGSKTMAQSYASDLDRLNEIDALLADGYIFRSSGYKELASMKYEQALITAARKPHLISRNYLRYELGEVSAIYEVEMEKGKKLLYDYIENYGYKDLKSPAWAYLRLAQIEHAKKNQEKALAYLDKSLEIDPNFEKALSEKQKIQNL